jgi:hypothetical protein
VSRNRRHQFGTLRYHRFVLLVEDTGRAPPKLGCALHARTARTRAGSER